LAYAAIGRRGSRGQAVNPMPDLYAGDSGLALAVYVVTRSSYMND